MEKNHGHGQAIEAKKVVWDCDSALYDSFELKSFKQQLDSAIATRSYSMPHLSNPAPPPASTAPKNMPSKISKSINRLLRSLLRMRPRLGTRSRGYGDMFGGGHLHGLRANYGALTTIPEACEKDAASSPDLSTVLGKSMSERFAAHTAMAVRISCP